MYQGENRQCVCSQGGYRLTISVAAALKFKAIKFKIREIQREIREAA